MLMTIPMMLPQAVIGGGCSQKPTLPTSNGRTATDKCMLCRTKTVNHGDTMTPSKLQHFNTFYVTFLAQLINSSFVHLHAKSPQKIKQKHTKIPSAMCRSTLRELESISSPQQMLGLKKPSDLFFLVTDLRFSQLHLDLRSQILCESPYKS